MNTTEEILVIANKLADDGKKPSVALIKTRLTQAVPLPTIISVLKNWQHQPNFTPSTPEVATNQNSNEKIDLTKSELNTLIKQALAPIEKELQEIKRLLKDYKPSI